MITINNAQTPSGETKNFEIKSPEDRVIDATGLLVLPGLIDPHVHFRTPGQEYKEDWRTASQAALSAGYTTVCDMPNNIPSCVSLDRLHDKQAIIDQQLLEAANPLRYHLYIGASRTHFDQIHLVRDQVCGIKIFMGSSTGDLLMDDESSLHGMFALAKAHNLLVAVHAEDECMIKERTANMPGNDFTLHSKIRTPAVAAKAVALALSLAKMYGVRLYILHVSSIPELQLIEQAKNDGVDVFAEACPHHLFLNTSAYDDLQGRAQMNPPLRDPEHQAALLAAVKSGVIDTMGSDHAPHTVDEKDQAYGKCPSGVPGIETNLPLLLNAVNKGDLSIENVLNLAHKGPRRLFGMPENSDLVLVDMNQTKIVSESRLKTKCGWSPYTNMPLQGWPKYTVCQGKLFSNP